MQQVSVQRPGKYETWPPSSAPAYLELKAVQDLHADAAEFI